MDDIIRELPEENTPSPRRPSPRHRDETRLALPVEDAMLNQPSSSAEDGDTSIGVFAPLNNSPLPPRTISPINAKQTVIVDAELYIDKIYSSSNRIGSPKKTMQMVDQDVEMPLWVGSIERPLSEKSTPSRVKSTLDDEHLEYEDDDYMDIDHDIYLLGGVNELHVRSCQLMTHEMHLMKFKDLLPAKRVKFERLKAKLFQGGSLGNIGWQVCIT